MNDFWVVLKSLLAAACILAFVGAAGAPAAAAAPPATPAADYIPGQVIVKYKVGVTAANARSDAARLHAAVKQQITGPAVPNGRLAVVHSDALTTKQLIARYEADPQVAYAEPDYIVHAYATPSDARFTELWGMQQIYAPAAWDVSHDSSSVVIADIDTGIDYTHPDLWPNVWINPGESGTKGTNGIDDDGNGFKDDVHGINTLAYYNGRGNGDPWDDNGHGTHTAGTMAAVGNNSTGVAGVCWTAKIMACKFLGPDGHGSTSGAIACINYVTAEKTDYGVNVVAANNSWGGGDDSLSLRSAINGAGSAGIVFVCSAGNDGVDIDTTPSYPASYSYSNIISVAATNGHDTLAYFSNFGSSSVDIGAPGVDILSTVPYATDSSRYTAWQGTSMAAPHVTGAIALCAVAFPGDTMAQRMDRVLDSTDPFPALSWACTTGGRLNLARALGGAAPDNADIPGLPMYRTELPVTLDASGQADGVYHVFLKAGTELNAGVGSFNADVYLFGPGATTVADKGTALAAGLAGAHLLYTVPTTGTYYLDAHLNSGSGNYALRCSTGSDEIPGVALPTSPVVTGMDEWSDNVYRVPMRYGQKLHAAVSGTGISNLMVYLLSPTAFSVWANPAILATSTTGDYPHTLDYTSWVTRTYYLDVSCHSGLGVGTLTWSVTGPGNNDISGASDIQGSGYSSFVSYAVNRDDVFQLLLSPSQTVTVSVSDSTAGTDMNLYLFGPDATTVEGHSGAVASSATASNPESLTFTAPPGDGGPIQPASMYYVDINAVAGDGVYTLTYSTLYDTTAPTTTATGLEAMATTGWRTTSQDVTLTPADTGGSGLAGTDYTLDGVPYTYSGPFTVSDPGSHVITYWSTDKAANLESTHTGYVNIDTMAPATRTHSLQATNATGWRNTPQLVTLTASDFDSGVDTTRYKFSALLLATTYTYSGPFTVSAPGSTSVYYWSTDAAGNTETWHHGYVNIDMVAPTTTNDYDGLPHQYVLITLTPSDVTSGVTDTQYRIDGGSWKSGTAVSLRLGIRHKLPGLAPGTHLVEYYSTDAAGNAEGVGNCSVTL